MPSRRPGAARSRRVPGCSPRRLDTFKRLLCAPGCDVIALREVVGMASVPSEPQPALFLAILLICPSGEDMFLVLAPSVVPGPLAGAPGGRGGACGAEAPGPRAA